MLFRSQFNGIRLRETWRGSFTRIPSEKKWGSLRMESEGASIPGNLQINFNKDGNFNDLNLNRLGGEISLNPKSNSFQWEANKFRLDRVEVAFPPEKSFKRIFGEVSSNGIISFDPLFVNGDLNLDNFRLLGFKLKNASIKGQVKNSETNLKGQLIPSKTSKIKFKKTKRSPIFKTYCFKLKKYIRSFRNITHRSSSRNRGSYI